MYTLIDEYLAKSNEYRIKTPINVADILCSNIDIQLLKDRSKVFADGYAKDGNIGFSILKAIINQTEFTAQQIKYIVENQLYFCTWTFLTETVKREFSYNVIKEYGINPINFKFNFVIINNKSNNMPHFDVTVMNPPYGKTGGDKLHINITNNIKKYSDITISLFPITFITKLNNDKLVELKQDFSNTLCFVKEIPSSLFENTWMPNVGIYFINSKKTSQVIEIELLSKQFTVNSLNDIKTFNEYESAITDILIKNGTQKMIGDFCRLNSWKRKDEDKSTTLKRIVPEICKKYKDIIQDKICVVTNTYIPVGKGIAFTSKLGKIFTKYEDLIDFFIENPYSRGTNLFLFNNIMEANNFILAIQNPVLRFTIYKLQDDQNLTKRIFKYIPAIDWKDPRVVTDEGLLEVCGCPVDKCKEYAEYCKNYMEKVDNGTLNS